MCVKVSDALCVDVALMMNACVRACVFAFLIGQIVSMQMGRRSVRRRGRKSKALVVLV